MEKRLTAKEKKEKKRAAKEQKLAKKRSFKLIPLVIVIALIVTPILSRNLILKWAIVAVSQSVAGAKCEIQSVQYDILSSTLKISGYQLGNKNNLLSNLFQFETLTCSISINQLLYRRLHIDEVSITGFEVRTPRTTSAALPEKKSTTKQKEKKSKKQKDTTSFIYENPLTTFDYKPLVTEIVSRITEGLTQSLPVTNTTSVINSCLNNLQTPEVAKDIQTYAEQLVLTWKDRPKEVQTQIHSLISRTKDVSTIRISKETTIPELQQYIQLCTNLYYEATELQNYLTTSYMDITTEGQHLNEKISNITNAYNSDKNLLSDSIISLSNTTIKNTNFIDQILSSIWDSVLSEAKPFVDNTIHLLTTLQNNTPKKEEVKKQGYTRLRGTTYTWEKNQPTFYIGRLYFSSMGYSGEILNITNNQHISKKPTYIAYTHQTRSYLDTIQGTIDLRGPDFEQPILNLEITWDSPIYITIPYTVNSVITGINANYQYKQDTTSVLTASGLFDTITINSPKTGLKSIDTILSGSLTDIKNINAHFAYETNSKPVFSTSLYTEIYSRVEKLFIEETKTLIDELNHQVTDYLNHYLSTYTGSVVEFENLQEVYTQSVQLVQESVNQTKAKIIEITDFAAQAGEAFQDAVNQITKEIEDTAMRTILETQTAANKAVENVEYAARAAVEQAVSETQKTIQKATEDAEAAVRDAAEQARREAEIAAQKAVEEAEAKTRAITEQAAKEAERAAKRAAEEAATKATQSVKNLFKR